MKPVSLSRCLDDQHLFGPFFRDESWRSWRVFLAALFAEPADEAGLAAYRAATGRTTWPSAPFSEAALIVGRRGGKSRILALIAVFLATTRDHSHCLAPGEVATIAVYRGQSLAGAVDFPLRERPAQGGAAHAAQDHLRNH